MLKKPHSFESRTHTIKCGLPVQDMNLKYILILCTFMFSSISGQSQTRFRFHYKISNAKALQLQTNGMPIVDADGNEMTICGTTKLKVFIKNDAKQLDIDPYSIKDSRINSRYEDTDPCYNQFGVINSNTKMPLSIKFNRKLVGDPTISIKIPYETFLVGFHSIGIKFRPKVTDHLDVERKATVTAAALNLGISAGYSRGYTAFTSRSANSYSVTVSGSFGFSSADFSKEPLKEAADLTGVGSRLILSPAGSIIFARNDLGLIVSYGWDFMTGKSGSKWAYHGKPFFGLGLAAGFKL